MATMLLVLVLVPLDACDKVLMVSGACDMLWVERCGVWLLWYLYSF